jgi:hypothetical protein
MLDSLNSQTAIDPVCPIRALKFGLASEDRLLHDALVVATKTDP